MSTVAVAPTREMHCFTCLKKVVFEQPPCSEGHGAECDEWACTVCGAAVVAGSLTITVQRRGKTVTRRVHIHRAA